MPADDSRAALTILGGYLGSGKSTWLRHQLRADGLAGADVVVNEAAGTPVDDLLLDAARSLTILAGGCACCEGRETLIAALRGWCDRRVAGTGGRRLVLETSGLADPARIIDTVRADPVLVHHLHIDRTIVTADAVNVQAQLATEPLGWRQLEAADEIVLTKTQALAAPDLAALAAALARTNPGARISAAEEGVALPLPDFAVATPAPLPARPEMADPAVATVLALASGTDPSAVLVWLAALLAARGADLIRVKGVIRTAAGRLLIQSVRDVVQQPQILPDADRPDSDDRLIVIGRGASPGLLRRSFAAFTAP